MSSSSDAEARENDSIRLLSFYKLQHIAGRHLELAAMLPLRGDRLADLEGSLALRGAAATEVGVVAGEHARAAMLAKLSRKWDLLNSNRLFCRHLCQAQHLVWMVGIQKVEPDPFEHKKTFLS